MKTSSGACPSLPFLLLLLGSSFLLMTSCAKKQIQVSEPVQPTTQEVKAEGDEAKAAEEAKSAADQDAKARAEAERQARLRELKMAQELACEEAAAPSFPWPPPRPSAKEVIPRKLLGAKRGPTQLRDVDRRITDALDQNGYFESSYYAVPEGFALVTKIEQIESDGTPKQEPLRWNVNSLPPFKFSLRAYLKALFTAQPGYYRVIVFIVTNKCFQTPPTVKVTPKEAEEWLSGGLNCLPASIGNLDFWRGSYDCTALIYEFERASETEEPKIRFPGLIPGRTHLVKAGIWEVLQQ